MGGCLKRSERAEQGFTMMETLLVVAIIGIMGALVFISILSYQRNLYQLEMDATAKEIYVAAQNHLSVAKASGALDQLEKQGAGKLGEKDGAASSAEGEAASAVYYYAVPESQALFRSADNALSQMLPFGSIDDTVRLNGSYVIRYQLSASTARVLDVFYADPHGRFATTLSSGDYASLVSSCIGTQSAQVEARKNFKGGIIGWWGGDLAAAFENDADVLDAPQIRVENDERLRVFVTDGDPSDNQASLRLEVRGVTSGAAMQIPLKREAGSGSATRESSFALTELGQVGQYIVDLDDVTDSGYFNSSIPSGHFADISAYDPYRDTTGPSFIPGEDITIQVIASSNIKFAADAKSAVVFTNSLFFSLYEEASADDGAESDGNAGSLGTQGLLPMAVQNSYVAANIDMTERTAVVSRIRHLENLDEDVSGRQMPGIVAAEQADDLSWPTFLANIKDTRNVAAHPESAIAINVSKHADRTSTPGNTFAPVNVGEAYTGAESDAGSFAYEGNGLSIEGIVVDSSGEAGLFGTLTNASVSNLELVNFDISSTGGNAGTLAGTLDGSAVSGVLAHYVSKQENPVAEAAVTGTANAGGLVGAIQNAPAETPAVRNSAAAHIVNGGASAGGLVGQVAGSATLRNSYAGGHTQDGSYSEDAANVTASTGAAGGLVGSATGAGSITLAGSYSTCSVWGATNAGGLLGSLAEGADVSNCYATGLVSGDTSALRGVLCGSNADLGRTNYYYEAVNFGREGIDTNGASALDESAAAYNAFGGAGGSFAPAVPYDSTLRSRYAGTYPLRTIAQLIGPDAYAAAVQQRDDDNNKVTPLTAQLTTHYGDWPSPETFVVNVR